MPPVNDISWIFDMWFEKINYYEEFNKENFITLKDDLQTYVNGVNIEDSRINVDYLQEDILYIIREHMLEVSLDDIYNIILEHLIIKNILLFRPAPFKYAEIIEERKQVLNDVIDINLDQWLDDENDRLFLFKNYFD